MALDTPLPYRLRSEIEWIPIQGRHRHWWVARDPLRSNIFRCGDEVKQLLQSLDGRRSIHDIHGMLPQNKSDQRISLQSIQAIVFSAIHKQLLIPCVDAENSRVKAHRSDTTRQADSLAEWLRFVQRSPWSMVQGKRRLGNAESFLKKLAKRTDWLFSWLAVYFWIAFIVLSAALVFARSADLDLFGLSNLTSGTSNAIHWIIILLLTRMAHELGHAIVCIRMGARCREFGVFFMLGIACPYVDVTDSWRLHNPRARMAIAAAGVYVEWVIAAFAGLVWYFSQPCWLHSVAWQVMVICSLTTLLINANPLIRYDGYFLLSDYLEVVNLREDSESAFKKFLGSWYLGDQSHVETRRLSWRDYGLVIYACSSWFYRCTLMIALILSVYTICTRWQLPILGWAFGMLSIVSFVLIPMGQKMFRSWSTTRRDSQSPYRLVAMWLGCVALIANIGWMPLPHRIACKGIVHPADRTFVYTQAAGRIPIAPFPDRKVSHSDEGSDNTSGPSCISLENPWVEDQARIAIQRQRQIACKISATRLAAYQEPSVIDRLPALSTMASIAEKQARNAIGEVNALNIVKPTQVSWVPIELPPLESLDGTGRSIQGHTVEEAESRGQWIPAGTPIGYITHSDDVSIAATIPISQLSNILVGMSARVRFDQLPSLVYTAKVVDVSGLTAVPDKFARNQNQNSSSGEGEDSDPSTLVSISLVVEGISQKMLAMDGTADVVVWTKPKSLYQHISHLAGATFGPNGLQTLSR